MGKTIKRNSWYGNKNWNNKPRSKKCKKIKNINKPQRKLKSINGDGSDEFDEY